MSAGWDAIDTAATVTGWERSEFTLLEWWPADHDLAAGTVAVEFVFADDRLRIVNGLDENRIEVGATPREYVRHGLGR
ncbi:hypothetical protein [Streptomyces sp. NPDC058751]|uniref:hypothetical protein n=1 Tax=Streptomyces sp. NPDC058751 TaxID=3346623 RepID=UPI0036ABC7F3